MYILLVRIIYSVYVQFNHTNLSKSYFHGEQGKVFLVLFNHSTDSLTDSV